MEEENNKNGEGKKEEIKWKEQAEEDLETAKYLSKGKKFKEASFYCQQACEKALKALSIKKTGELRKIHDLVVLGKDVGLPEELSEKIKELTLAYLYSRYPDIAESANLEDKFPKFLDGAIEVIEWVKKNL